MVLPGIQALWGFQLVAAFNARFTELSYGEQTAHFAALVLVALAIGLIMTPAAYHRVAEQTSVSGFFVRLSSWLIAAAMLPLMVAICIETYLLGGLITGAVGLSFLVSGVLLCVFAGLWFIFPILVRQRNP
jgi:hypothetical protein